MADKAWNDQLAMQNNCIHCGKPQMMALIKAISEGREKCVWCKKAGEPMTNAEYLERQKQFQQKGKRDYH